MSETADPDLLAGGDDHCRAPDRDHRGQQVRSGFDEVWCLEIDEHLRADLVLAD